MNNAANDLRISQGVFDQINALCRQFLGEHKSGVQPSIEAYLARVPENAQATLLRNVLGIEIEFRRRRQEHPTSDEYIRRLPKYASLIREAFFESTLRSVQGGVSTGTAARPEVAATADFAIPGANRLGDYQLVRELGRGGFGIVFEAMHIRRGNRVALKTLPLGQDGFGDADALQQFKGEFRSLADINHPHLVGLHSLETDGAQWFFTMDLVQGVDFLTHVRPDGELNEMRLREALAQLASGVMGLHGRGIMHRDLKPSNVLVRDDGHVVILDFGLVVELERRTELARTQGFAGTPAYAAPEQALGTRTAASDWYAVGVMLYEALAGRLPFAADNWLRLLELKRQQDPSPLADTCGVPDDLAQLAMRLLTRDPAQRADALEVAKVVSARTSARPTYASGRGQLIGRGHQLAVLQQSLSDLETRSRTLTVLISGRSGEGKTSLVEHFLEPQRQRRQVTVLSGRCYDRESVPFKAMDGLIDALASHLRALPEAEAALLVPDDVAFLAHVFPVLRRVPVIFKAAAGVQFSLLDQQQVRARAFAALRSLLFRLGQRSAVIMFIDDLQWGDADSAQVMFDVLKPPESPRLLFLGTCRSEEMEDSAFLDAWQDLAQRRNVALPRQDVTVDPLTQDQCLELVLSEVGRDSSHIRQLATEFYLETGGNPFLLLELIGCFDPDSDSFRPLPLQEVIARKLENLPSDAAQLLEVIAVSGQALSLEEASSVAGHQAVPMSTITHMRTEKLVRLLGSDEHSRVDTYHDKVRETVLQCMDKPRRQATHRRLADTIAAGLGEIATIVLDGVRRDPPTEPDEQTPALPRLYDLSYHYDAAGEQQLAASYALLAAEQARRQFALDVAAEQYAIAARNAGEQPIAFQHRLGSGRGETSMLLGKYQEAQVEFEKAFKISTTDLQQARVSQHMVANAFKQGALADAEGHARDALERLNIWVPRTLPGFLVGIGQQALIHFWHSVRPGTLHRLSLTPEVDCTIRTIQEMSKCLGFRSSPRAIWGYLAALNHAELVRACPALSEAQSLGCILFSTLGWHSRAQRFAQLALRTSIDLNDVRGIGIATTWHGMANWAAGHYAEGLAQLSEAIGAFGRMGDFWFLNFSRFHAACCHFSLGDLAAAITEARTTFESSIRIGDTRSNCSLYLWSKAVEGNLPFDELQSCCALASGDVLCSCNRAMAEGHWHLGAGRTEQAIDTFERVIKLGKQNRLLNFHPIDALPWLVHALRLRAQELLETDRAESHRLLKRALRLGKRSAWITRFFPTSQASTLRELGLVYADRGNVRKALRLVAKSLAVAEKLGAKYEQAQSSLVHGQLRKRLGHEGADEEIESATATLHIIRDAAHQAATAPLA